MKFWEPTLLLHIRVAARGELFIRFLRTGYREMSDCKHTLLCVRQEDYTCLQYSSPLQAGVILYTNTQKGVITIRHV